MKRFFYAAIVVAVFAGASQTNAQSNANKTLSNLTSPTSVNVDLLPNSTSARNLGSTSKSWNNIYTNGAVFFNGTRFIATDGLFDSFLGGSAGLSNTTGNNNVGLGFQSLFSNTSGASNVGIGTNTLYHNIDGYQNTATGQGALFNNTSGYWNVANGASCMGTNTTGFFNTATGANAMFFNSTGNYNTAIGTQSLYLNSIGSNNTAVGDFSLFSNSSGISNTGTGLYALYYNTTGSWNTATGVDALLANSTGIDNTANGVDVMYENTTGGGNTAMGMDAMFWNFTGDWNVAVGNLALNQTTTSGFNTSVGYNSGATYDNGWNNVFLGANTGPNGSGYYNDVAIGQATLCTAVSQARIGNSATTSIGGYANWSNISDIRVKKNIRQNVPGLAFINKLQPITYNLDLEAIDRITQPVAAKDKDGKPIEPNQQEIEARKAKEQVVYTGFAAQDVEKAAQSLNYDFSGVDAAKNDKDLYSLRYGDFVVPLVKAVQELSSQNDSLKKENENQLAINADLESRLAKLEALMHVTTGTNDQTINLSSASLGQNTPNPFSSSTTISYTLPQQFDAAQIIITDRTGKTLREITVSGSGNGSVNINTSMLSAGTYQYSLLVNGKLIDTKQMVVTK